MQEETIPFQSLIARSREAINKIDEKTKSFQHPSDKEPMTPMGISQVRSKFEIELSNLAELLEELNNKLLL